MWQGQNVPAGKKVSHDSAPSSKNNTPFTHSFHQKLVMAIHEALRSDHLQTPGSVHASGSLSLLKALETKE